MSVEADAVVDQDLRAGEVAVGLPGETDAVLYFIGRIRTPWRQRKDCPRQGDLEGPLCRIEVDERWRQALRGLKSGDRAQILYWMDRARRDLVLQVPRGAGDATGTFSIRSPVRPNPIAISVVAIESATPDGLMVRGLDCLDGTPLLDVKPETCPHGSPTG